MTELTLLALLGLTVAVVGAILSSLKESLLGIFLTIVLTATLLYSYDSEAFTKETAVVVETTSNYQNFEKGKYLINQKIEEVSYEKFPNNVRDGDELEITIIETRHLLLTPLQALTKPNRVAKISIKVDE